MIRSIRNVFLTGTVVISSAATLFAAPEISVDSADFNVGIINEGSRTSIKHSFKIKNIGNETLKISKVRPGCGCTAVGYDSIIAPGKEGSVEAEVKLAGFRPGVLRKYITVYSNAKAKPEISLSLACNLRSELNIEPMYLSLTADQSGIVTQTFSIVSNKADLAISSVKFKEDPKPTNTASAWQNDLPITFTHTLTKTDKVHPDGFVEYSLVITLQLPVGKAASMYGKVTVATNHPKKPEVDLTGSIAYTPQ